MLYMRLPNCQGIVSMAVGALGKGGLAANDREGESEDTYGPRTRKYMTRNMAETGLILHGYSYL